MCRLRQHRPSLINLTNPPPFRDCFMQDIRRINFEGRGKFINEFHHQGKNLVSQNNPAIFEISMSLFHYMSNPFSLNFYARFFPIFNYNVQPIQKFKGSDKFITVIEHRVHVKSELTRLHIFRRFLR